LSCGDKSARFKPFLSADKPFFVSPMPRWQNAGKPRKIT